MAQKLNLKAPWHDVKEKLKENDVTLTDEDLEYEPGKDEELLARLGARLNKNAEEVRVYIESISANETKAG